MSFNKWNYTDSNPINFSDPLGLFKTVVFYFPGMGNEGDTDGSNTFDDFEADEGGIVTAIKSIPNVIVVPIYPYSTGLKNTNIVSRWATLQGVLSGISLLADIVPNAKVTEVLNGLEKALHIFCTESPYPAIDEEYQTVFISYSAGGAIAYATAQKLKDKLYIYKMILIGSHQHKAIYKGLSNIGELWELYGQHDLELQQPKSGLFDSTVEGATRCVFYNNEGDLYSHGSYMENRDKNKKEIINDAGVTCRGKYSLDKSKSNMTRLDAITQLMRDVITSSSSR